jgi:hypothetical protein
VFGVLRFLDDFSVELQNSIAAYQNIPLFVLFLEAVDQLLHLAMACSLIVLLGSWKSLLIEVFSECAWNSLINQTLII